MQSSDELLTTLHTPQSTRKKEGGAAKAAKVVKTKKKNWKIIQIPCYDEVGKEKIF